MGERFEELRFEMGQVRHLRIQIIAYSELLVKDFQDHFGMFFAASLIFRSQTSDGAIHPIHQQLKEIL